MELNPYAKFLAGRDPTEVIGSTSAELDKLVCRLPPSQTELRQPAGKWSAREIIAHLADCELVFAFRLRQTLAEEAPIIQPFDQDKWATTYLGVPANQALEVFTAMRGWNLRL